MCFSASASFIASGILTTIGIASLLSVRDRAAYCLASVPLFFAIQQAAEGLVWTGLNNNLFSLALAGTLLYLFFAYLFWPVFIPISLYKLETHPARKKLLLVVCALGALFDVIMLCHGCCGITAARIENHIAYTTSLPSHYYTFLTTLYAIAVIIPFFIVRYRNCWLFGICLALSMIYSYWAYALHFTSIWCFFSALLSMIIVIIVRNYPHAKAKRTF